ncbi:rubredoxin-like domain-containing protein [Gallicola sp. Sow4_E12]
MKRWRCIICSYIYEGDTPPAFCPVCGASSDDFEMK